MGLKLGEVGGIQMALVVVGHRCIQALVANLGSKLALSHKS